MAEHDPLDLAARALRHRDRSRRDVDDRLTRAGVGDAARGEALEQLERLGYVDDARFARTRAETLARRGHGDAAIRADLEAQGIDPETAAAALAALQPEAERAAELVAREGRTVRTGARLARKGFPPELLEELIRPDGTAGENFP